jgi:hypothetical protein
LRIASLPKHSLTLRIASDLIEFAAII